MSFLTKRLKGSLTLSGSSVYLALLLCSQLGCSRGPQYYLDRGNRFYSEGKFPDAVLSYRSSLQKDVKSAEAHYRLGLAELKLGNSSSAYEEFQRAVRLAPDREDIRVESADLALRSYSGDPNKPKFLYNQVNETADFLLKRDPSSFNGLRLRGDMLAIDGRLDEALVLFRKANAIKPLDAGVIMPMVQVLFALKQSAEGESLAQKCIDAHKDFGPIYDVLVNQYVKTERMPQAEAVLKSKMANMPNDPGPVLDLASFYSERQRAGAMIETLEILNNTKQFPEGRQLRGDFYAGKRKYDEALSEYREGMQSDPKRKVIYQKGIAKVLISQQKRSEAIEELNQVVQADPLDMDARLARGILLRDATEPKELDLAVGDLNEVLLKNPNDEVARYNLGIVYLGKGEVKQARQRFVESANLRRNYPAPRLALAEMAQRERKYDECIRLTEEVLAVDPANSTARLWRAAGLLGSRSYQRARTELNALLRESPDSLVVNLHMGVLDTAEKKYRDAESRYLRFYKLGEKDLRPLEGLLQVYGAQGQSEKSLKLLDQELKQAPTSRPLHLLLAGTATRAGKLDVAMAQYEWLRSNDPKSLLSYVSLGDLYQMKGDLSSALASYEKARQLAPNDAKIIAMVAYMQTVSGQNVEAIASLRQQLSLDPANLVAQNNLAFALAESGTDLDQALSLAETASRKEPNNPGIADTLGWVYTKKGLNASAVQIFKELVKKAPDEPSFRYHLGVALLQQGKSTEAKTEFTLALSKNPPKEMAGKIKDIVAKIN